MQRWLAGKILAESASLVRQAASHARKRVTQGLAGRRQVRPLSTQTSSAPLNPASNSVKLTLKKFLAPQYAGGASVLFAAAAYSLGHPAPAAGGHSSNPEKDKEAFEQAGRFIQGLPLYTADEVSKHKTFEQRIWVVFREGVYDITEFIEAHPGRDKILLASGGSIEPFWGMYPQHQVANVVEILEGLRIGNFKPDTSQPAPSSSDPYTADPRRHPALVVRSAKPYNAETPLSLLAENYITPNDLFYVRNHLPVPEVDPNTYVLEITGESIPNPIKLTLEDLKTKFPQHSVTATIQCAGNRRNEMTRHKSVKGGEWEVGAISNATWTGPKLRDVLFWAGLPHDGGDMQHIHFVGLDKDFEKHYGASIPIEKALSSDGDCILATQMNGSELPKDHGFPVRAVVPGVVGARNVKWLGKIHASKVESPSHWQQFDYKGFSNSVDWHNVEWNTAPAIQELPVTSAITEPAPGAVLDEDATEVTVKGYAWSGGGRGIVRVDVSNDGGETWVPAKLKSRPTQPYNRVWAWTLWEHSFQLPEGDKKVDAMTVLCKAVDSSYNTQPESVAAIWNMRGVLNNAWHKVDVKTK